MPEKPLTPAQRRALEALADGREWGLASIEGRLPIVRTGPFSSPRDVLARWMGQLAERGLVRETVLYHWAITEAGRQALKGDDRA